MDKTFRRLLKALHIFAYGCMGAVFVSLFTINPVAVSTAFVLGCAFGHFEINAIEQLIKEELEEGVGE